MYMLSSRPLIVDISRLNVVVFDFGCLEMIVNLFHVWNVGWFVWLRRSGLKLLFFANDEQR